MIFRPLFLATLLPLASAFGPATPIFTGGVVNNDQQLTMRVSVSDMKRRQKITGMLDRAVVAGNPTATKQAIETTVVTERTASILEAANWKLRNSMLRKVRILANKYDVPVELSFGMPMPRLEKEALQAKEATVKKAARKIHFDQVKVDRDARVKANRKAEIGTEGYKKKLVAIRATKKEEKMAEQEAEDLEKEVAERTKSKASAANLEEATGVAEAKEEAKAAAKVEAKKAEKAEGKK
jgi:hypothetical protein